MQQFIFAILNGLSTGMAVFLVAAGLTLIFGILKILTFAHGAFFMVGAYVAYSIIGHSTPGVAQLILASLAGGGVVGVLGYFTDKVVFQRLRDQDPHYVLIATFALLLTVNGAVKLIWGLDYHSISPPDALADTISIRGVMVPTFSFFVIILGALVFALLEICVHRMWIGKIVQALVNDSWMTGLMGYNVPLLYTGTVVAACVLAGFAGGLLLPNQSLSPALGDAYILLAFVAVIIGGLGNVRGAFVAALLLGVIDSVSSVVYRNFPGLAVYIGMVVMLLARPQGLFGQRSDSALAGMGWRGLTRRRSARTAGPRPARPALVQAALRRAPADLRLTDQKRTLLFPVLGAVLALAAVSLPLWANHGIIFVAGLALIEVLFALSWHFLFGYAGIASFGHAAFFALGAYGLGVFLKGASAVPFLALLAGAAVVGAVVAGLVGLVALRRSSGMYLAILTMALCEIVRIVVGYSPLLGKDEGLVAIPRPVLNLGIARLDLAPDGNYYWFLFIAVALLGGVLWWLVHSRFGRVLRSLQQDPERTAFLGVNVTHYRLFAFMLSGATASVAGALSAPWTQIVTPDTANLVHSTAPILNTLLGGVSSFWGPILGSAVFAAISYGTRTLAACPRS